MKRPDFIIALMVMALGAAVPGELVSQDIPTFSSPTLEREKAIDGLTIVDRYMVDYCTSSSVGEDNGVFDPGETRAVWFWLRNDTAYPLSAVSVTLMSVSQTLIVLSGTVSYPDLSLGETGVSVEPFWVTISSEFIIEPSVLYVSSAEGSWEIPFPFGACGWFSYPLRKEFEVWPIRDWQSYGDPNNGGWKNNEDWGHPNATGGTSYGLCAEGIALPSGLGVWQELRTRTVHFFATAGPWAIWYRSNFTGALGGGVAQVEMSQDGGLSWSVIGTKSNDDPIDGLYTVHYFELPVEYDSDVVFRFRLFSGSQGASWQIDRMATWFLGGPAGPPPDVCVPCSPPPPCDTPADAQLLSPQDGITGVGTEILLSWNPGDFADYYEVYAGPRMGQFTLMGTTTDSSFLITGLASATRYEWMISSVNECGFNHSRVRAFTTAGGEDDGGHDRPVSPP